MVKKINEGAVNNVSSRAEMIGKIIDTYLYETEDDAFNDNIWQEGYDMVEEAFDRCLHVNLEILEDGNWDISEGIFEPITTEGIKKVYQYLVRSYPM